jgi:hypothetical protein
MASAEARKGKWAMLDGDSMVTVQTISSEMLAKTRLPDRLVDCAGPTVQPPEWMAPSARRG